ncbi:magnesium transporter [Halopolyspora algeriensis]|uniref:Magnesium transport protein CorA n=1 Tax=Halopolyspora algeriensis TaxID=1500506 RepID=A0A368VYB7_9ACTN|nr:magnesium/cobalt transporter CorA [Halopolyspora algeriensis]RCW46951.1 magnesium transporter [Halopolyspora algeriensis]TQM48041.1 magnesium transporter [Halopolyspora algeriensis]
MVMVDSAIYASGLREHDCDTLAATYRHLRSGPSRPDRFSWIGLLRPDEEEVASITEEFELHPLAVEDAVVAHQRPKVEHYDDILFMVLRPARYLDEQEDVEIGEIHVFVGPDFVITVRHAEKPDLAPVRQRLEQDPALLGHGPESVLYALLDRVVDDLVPVERGLQNDLDEIESEVFGGEPAVSARIYRLSREVIEFQRASRPLLELLDTLETHFTRREVDVELLRNLRDVRDHASDVVERVESHRQLLSGILTVNASLHAQRQNEQAARLTETSLTQNEDMKRISSWAAILFTPTVVGTVYGMNFTRMPELDWAFGYPMALGLMVIVAVALYVVFRRRGWL